MKAVYRLARNGHHQPLITCAKVMLCAQVLLCAQELWERLQPRSANAETSINNEKRHNTLEQIYCIVQSMHDPESPHSQELRKGRRSQRHQIYLITTRCSSKQPTFCDPKLGQIVVDEIQRSDSAGNSQTFAFVVMPDHLHWLFELSGQLSLSRVVGCLKGRVSRRINLIREKTMPVWQPGFHDRALRRMESVHEAGCYIVNNPVRAGLVSQYSEYPLLYAPWLEGGMGISNRG